MSTEPIISQAEERMKKAISQLQKEYQTIRTGRANPALLDRIDVEYYGTSTPLKSLANISTPDGRSLLIQPYDKGAIKEIETAIHKSDVGLTPTTDGSLIRISVPQLTEERRKEIVKTVKKFGEDTRIALRNIRRDAADELKKLKGTQISEDEIKREEEHLQKVVDKYVKEIDKHVHDKETEVMAV